MRGATRVQDAAGIRQVLHQQAGPAGMVEMNVRQENKVDVGDIEALLTQRIQQQRYGIVGAGIDERAAALFDDEVTGVLQRAQIFSVDGDDAIVECRYVRALIQAWSSRVLSGWRNNEQAGECLPQQAALPAPS